MFLMIEDRFHVKIDFDCILVFLSTELTMFDLLTYEMALGHRFFITLASFKQDSVILIKFNLTDFACNIHNFNLQLFWE